MPTGRDSPESVLAAFAANGMYPLGEPTTLPESAVPSETLSKYRNRKTEIDGHIFDSKKESLRYLDLREQQRARQITELECQAPFPLMVNGVKVGEYFADFCYKRDGKEVIEDVKSEVTRRLPVYRLKRKILEANGIIIEEV